MTGAIGMRLAGWIGLVLTLGCGAVFAKDVSEARKQLEASMLIKGTITIDTKGKVRGFEFGEQDKLPAKVVELLRNNVAQWKFEPVVIDGKPVAAKTDMNVRVIAKQLPDNRLQIRIGGATFGEGAPTANEIVRPRKKLSPPEYPGMAAGANAGGSVYLMLKIGRTGKVEDAVVEQVNLGVVGTEKEIAWLRDAFTKSALRQARRWSFIPPTAGPDAGAEFWLMRVPVVYSMIGTKRPGYGEWEAYLPGPRHPIPWEMKGEGLAFSPDALPEGSVHMAGSGLKLLTAPES
jgi:hypothetical protein